MPSPSESALLADRLAILTRQICRKREFFFRLHASAADRIEEDDEWAEREQKSGPESSLREFRPKDARARRRARVRPETSSRHDKAMVISQSGEPASGPSKVIDDNESRNPAESVVNRSARDRDYLRLSAIGMIPRGQPPGSSLSEPSSTRQPLCRRESRDARSDILFARSSRSFASRDKSADLRTVVPFALSSIRPMKFGGYRPPAGVVLKNLSSGSESEFADANREQLPFVRKNDDSTAIFELSSPESKIAAIDKPITKMPIMCAKSDITRPILPSARSSRGDLSSCYRTYRDTAGDRVEDSQINRDGFAWIFDDEQVSQDEHSMRICNEHRRLEAEHEDAHDEKDDVSQSASTFAAGNSVLESTELVTSICDERILASHDELGARASQEFKQAESELEDERGSKVAVDSYRLIRPTTFEIDREYESEGDLADRLTSVSARGNIDSPRLIDGIPRDTTEEASSSRTSERFGSEDRSRSSCAPKTHSRRETLVRGGMLPRRRFQYTSDERCEREITTNVPTLALNSQNVSCSTSAGSRECSATRPLDPRALIRALSDVSLRQGEGWKNVPRKCDGAPRREKDMADVSSGASDFPAMGETWRVSSFSMSESPGRLPSRDLPSRIPVRIPSGKIISCDNADRLLACRHDRRSENLNAMIANRGAAILIDRNDVRSVVGGNIARRQVEAYSPYSQNCERASLLKSRRDGVAVTIVEARSGTSAPEDEAAGYETNDYEPGSLTSSNLPSPRSISCGDRHTHREAQRASENGFGGGDRQAVFLGEAVYPGDRDFSKIDDDDDARSRSDCSTSQKSADTADVTSVNESLCLPKHDDDGPILEDQSSLFEPSRNVKENTECGTEDECASSNGEENAEDAKTEGYYETYNNRPEGAYLERKERFKATIEETYDSLLFKSHPPRVGAPSEIEKVTTKRRDDLEFHADKSDFDRYLEATKIAQSDSLVFQIRRTHGISSFAANASSSTLNLNCETRKKKRSQERFPFTISEASGLLPAKRNNTTDCQPPDKDFRRTKVDEHAEEMIVHRLKVHPSITRLATAGLEDTVAEILCCSVQDQKNDKSSSRSKMKGLVRMFSAKLRRGPKQRNDIQIPDTTKIIYENRACRADSRTNSCSDGSSTERIQNTNHDSSSNTRRIPHRVVGSNPTLGSDGNILKKTEGLEAIPREHPRRRYDRDDLWVQNLEKFSHAVEDDDETLRKQERTSPSRDRYSIFLAKNLQSAKPAESKTEHDNSTGGQQRDALIIGGMVPSVGKSKKSERARANPVSEMEEIEEDLTGCLCSGLCRLITPSKYRLSIREQVSSPKTKVSGTLLRKRKK